MLEIDRITATTLRTNPFKWAFSDRLFAPAAAAALAASFPRDKFRTVKGYDGEKGYEYVSRSLIHMGSDNPSYVEGLSSVWQELARDLLCPAYRSAMTQLTKLDLSAAELEVNVVHYGPGAWLGPHVDLKEKMMTHVFYFNETWDPKNGGCLGILRSSDPSDVASWVVPIVGSSVVIVRSDRSWHMVSKVVEGSRLSRLSMNVIFHLPGSISTMWPPGADVPLRDV
jgi:SM-20-related protein